MPPPWTKTYARHCSLMKEKYQEIWKSESRGMMENFMIQKFLSQPCLRNLTENGRKFHFYHSFFGTPGTLTINSHNLNLLKIRYKILSPPGIQFISGNLFIVITILLVCLEPNISKVQKNYSGWWRYDATLAAYSNLKTSKNPLLRNPKKTESPFIIIFIIRGKAFQTIIPEELLELNGSKFDHI